MAGEGGGAGDVIDDNPLYEKVTPLSLSATISSFLALTREINTGQKFRYSRFVLQLLLFFSGLNLNHRNRQTDIDMSSDVDKMRKNTFLSIPLQKRPLDIYYGTFPGFLPSPTVSLLVKIINIYL